ncbi:hypothetical protein D3C80_1667770 [compost metagenome]
MAQTCVHTSRFNQTAIDERRVEAGFRINTGHHRRGRRFAVRTRNGNSVTKTHQFCQHLCTADHRDARFMRRYDFRVIR